MDAWVAAAGALALASALVPSDGRADAQPPTARAAIAPSEPAASLDEAVRNLRSAAAISTRLMLAGLDRPGRDVAIGAFGDDPRHVRGVAWSLFFEGAVAMPGPAAADQASAAFFNPVYDGVVLTRWRRVDGRWSLAEVKVMTGARVRGEAASPAASWTRGVGSPLGESLARIGLPTATQLADAVGGTDDTDLVLGRVVAFQRGLGKLAADAPARARLVAVLLAWSADEPSLRAAGLSVADARRVASLPRPVRGEPVMLGALETKDGFVAVLEPRGSPRLIYLAGVRSDGSSPVLTPVLVSLPAKGARP